MKNISGTDRRTFLRRTAAGAGALWVGALQDFAVHRAHGEHLPGGSPYGPLFPTLDGTSKIPLLELPEGFQYISYGWTGDLMSDGVKTPDLHDGMAVVAEIRGRHFFADDDRGRPGWWDDGDDDDDDDHKRGRGGDDDDDRYGHRSGRLILVRNHETDQVDPPNSPRGPYVNRPSITYLNDGPGGTTNLVFNAKQGRFEKVWSSLAGTIRNCAGGVTPWGTWITSEETGRVNHGWNFDVGPLVGSPIPLKDMGLFSHEAVMVDSSSWYVYETEDANDCGFYRFVPNRRGQLHKGGRLYMLKVVGQWNADLGGAFPLGTKWNVEWVRIDDPHATATSVYEQGKAKGGARFRRLEGCWWEGRVGYFLSTDGGQVGEGQVFEYDPRRERIKLIYDSPSQAEAENPDNIVVTPRGGLLMCEDNAGASTNDAERLLGLTLEGKAFTFAKNNMNLAVIGVPPGKTVAANDFRQSEWAGACYSPDGRWLFVNIQTPGVTFAITGPWRKGPL